MRNNNMLILKGNKEDFVLSITFYDIIQEIKDIDNYKWKLLWIDGVNFNIHMDELEKKVNKSKEGYFINSNELIYLSKSFYQLLEVVLIGYLPMKELKIDDDSILKQEVEFFIELVDGSFWEITSKNQNFLHNIKSKFDYEEIAEEKTQL